MCRGGRGGCLLWSRGSGAAFGSVGSRSMMVGAAWCDERTVAGNMV